jgi:predicted amidophosphoribosyltransferase
MAKGCLYCRTQLPDTADFCPQCGRSIKEAIRIESGVMMKSTTMAKGCLYCGLQLPDTTEFCPQCGRPIERGFEIRPILESEFDCVRKEVKGKGDLMRQHGFYFECIDFISPLTHMEEYAHTENSPECEAPPARRDRNTTSNLATRDISSFQSDQPLLSRV